MDNSTVAPVAKPRLDILDGLRGVGAFIVILFHFGEAFATSPLDQFMNHAYLAVDFFFVLSGFVIGYAYRDRWKGVSALTPGRFMVRRVIRLQPMVVLGALLGFGAYLIQGCCRWDGTQMPLTSLGVALVCSLFLIPAWPGCFYDMRGNGEMFSLNGPEWSLFFEYIGSLLYAFVLHRLNNRALLATIVCAATCMIAYNIQNYGGFYTQGSGWSFAEHGLAGGGFRMAYCFGAGVLMSRWKRRVEIRGAFWICGVLLVAACALPNLSDGHTPSVWNMVYDSAMTLFLLPALVFIGACGVTGDKTSASTCEFLGRLSYPVYIVHYPAMYLFYNWVWSHRLSFSQAWPGCVLVVVVVVTVAWLAARFYDEPVRRWLSRRLTSGKSPAKVSPSL